MQNNTNIQWNTAQKLGEFELNKIYCMDCLEGLKKILDNSVDFILTDPPFNVNLTYEENFDDDMDDEEYSEWCYKWISELERVLKEGKYCIIFSGDKKLYYLMKAIYKTKFKFHHFFKWYKPTCQRGLSGTVLFYKTELAFILSKGKPDISKINRKLMFSDTFSCENNTSKRNDDCIRFNHPASRPLRLYRYLIKGFNPEKIVLDCFMGSGTTAVAQICENYAACRLYRALIKREYKKRKK